MRIHYLPIVALTAARVLGISDSGAAADDHIESMPLATLDMFDQLALERRALRILAMPQIQQQKKQVEEIFRKSWLADTPDGRYQLERAAGRFTLAAIEDAIVSDLARPRMMWVNTQPRRWYGVEWPGTCWGAHNPDNMSRAVMINGDSWYEVSGQRLGAGPSQETFLLNGAIVGTQAQNTEGAPVLASLRNDQIKYEAGGSFMITIGPKPAAPGINHLQSQPGANVLRVRDTMSDWQNEFPSRLQIRRVAGPPAPPAPTDDEIADMVVGLLKLQPAYWLKYYQDQVYSAPPNTAKFMGGRVGGWGFLSLGWFQLKEDEALVFIVDPLDAAYSAIQVTDPWTVPPNYINLNGGLNRAQAKANADGTITYVVAAKDPGVWNWIDTDGMHLGTYTIRWQGLTTPPDVAEKAIRNTSLVRFADLKTVLPIETVWVDAAARQRQLADRAAAFALRLAN